MKGLVYTILTLIVLSVSPLYSETIPDEAKKAISEGADIIEKAKGIRDYLEAEEKFEKAVAIAPLWPEAHYNLAILSEELGKELKAIRAYERYLQLSKDAKDRDEILAHIDKLKMAKRIKKEIGLAGINLIALKDGIYIKGVLAGSKLAKAGFQTGDKIVEVNKVGVKGVKLDEFYRLIKTELENTRLGARIQAYGRNKGIVNPVAFTIIRGGSQQVIVASADAFKTKLIEIEEDEIESEVLKSDRPVLLLFWADWCSFCIELIPIMDEVADRYSESLKIVTINLDFNRKASKIFEIKAVPHVIYYRGGKVVGSFTGKKSKNEIEEFLRADFDRGRVLSTEKSTAKSEQDCLVNLDEMDLLAVPLIKTSQADKVGIAIGDKNGQFVILDIRPGSLAEKSGLKRCDVIVRVNNMDLNNASLKDLITHLQEEEKIILYIKRRSGR